MSGAFNQKPSPAWVKWENPRKRLSIMEKYKTVMAVIVGGSQKGKTPKVIYLSDAVVKALGHPKFVEIHVEPQGSNIGLAACDENAAGFTVNYADEHDRTGTHINAFGLISAYNLHTGVYDAHYRGAPNGAGMVIFDSAETPARI